MLKDVMTEPPNHTVRNQTLASILGDNSDAQQITSDLVLPSSIPGITGVGITWTSSDNSLVSSNGVVTRPTGVTNLPVTLTARLSRAGRDQIETQDKVFSVTVSSQ